MEDTLYTHDVFLATMWEQLACGRVPLLLPHLKALAVLLLAMALLAMAAALVQAACVQALAHHLLLYLLLERLQAQAACMLTGLFEGYGWRLMGVEMNENELLIAFCG